MAVVAHAFLKDHNFTHMWWKRLLCTTIKYLTGFKYFSMISISMSLILKLQAFKTNIFSESLPPLSKMEYQWPDLFSIPNHPKQQTIYLYLYDLHIQLYLYPLYYLPFSPCIHATYMNICSGSQETNWQWEMFSETWKINMILSSLTSWREFLGWGTEGEHETRVQGSPWIEGTELRVQRKKMWLELQHVLWRDLQIDNCISK